MKLTNKSGAALAATAAALYFSGVATTPVAQAAADMGHCYGVNACKGNGACKGTANACKGKNACKGQGWAEMTKEDCGKKEGAKFVEAAADVPR